MNEVANVIAIKEAEYGAFWRVYDDISTTFNYVII
jgi:hypothetical protein